MTTSIRHLDNREALLTLLTAPGRYPIEVRDDSMSAVGIYSGDTLVIQSQRHARNGDIVVALIDNADVTVKRVQFRGSNQIKLIADHQDSASITLTTDRVEIQGKVIGQIRRYQ
ncbi:MAG: S24 family peptidase [Pseudomonadota bacterium]